MSSGQYRSAASTKLFLRRTISRTRIIVATVWYKMCVLSYDHNSLWRISGGSSTGHLGPTQGLERIVDALPRAKHGEMQGCHQQKTDPDHQRIPTSLHTGSLTGVGVSSDTITGPIYHSVRGPQHQHRPIPESAQSAFRCSVSVILSDRPPPPLPSVLEVSEHEDMVSG